jgi:hypothetical protein
MYMLLHRALLLNHTTDDIVNIVDICGRLLIFMFISAAVCLLAPAAVAVRMKPIINTDTVLKVERVHI